MKFYLKLLFAATLFLSVVGCEKEQINQITQETTLGNIESRSSDPELVDKLVSDEDFRTVIVTYLALVGKVIKNIEESSERERQNIDFLSQRLSNSSSEISNSEKTFILSKMETTEEDLEKLEQNLNNTLAKVNRRILASNSLSQETIQNSVEIATSNVVQDVMISISLGTDVPQLLAASGNIWNFRCNPPSFKDDNGLPCPDPSCAEIFNNDAYAEVIEAISRVNTNCILTPGGVVITYIGAGTTLGGPIGLAFTSVTGVLSGGLYAANCIYNERDLLRRRCNKVQQAAVDCCGW